MKKCEEKKNYLDAPQWKIDIEDNVLSYVKNNRKLS